MKTIEVDLSSNKYDIVIQSGIFKNSGEEITKIYKEKKIAVITDENVLELHGYELKKSLLNHSYDVRFITIKPGEKSKSLESLTKIYNDLIDFGITRSHLIIAFGGGVVGDLAGFAASTYLRGIDYVQIPTTLLSQIDSSIGGKVGVNLDKGKNLVGSFYQPKKVIIDSHVLTTLPEKYIKDGLGEVIKYACIKDADFFEQLMEIKTNEELFQNMEDIIFRCCNIKRQYVESDERDTGLRMILNFGHTFGHAVEKYFDYEKTHGWAVALGMYHITQKSESLGYTEPGTAEKIKNILINFNMEYQMPSMDMDMIKKTVCLDKKNLSDKINLILIKKIGESFIEKISVEDIDKFI